MMYYTHIVFALLLGVIYSKIYIVSLVIVLFCLIGSLLPDIDHPKSKVNIWPFSYFFKHRGIMHSVVPLLAMVFFLLVFPSGKLVFTGLLIGYASHLVLDSMNPKGVQILYPFSKLKIKGYIKTKSVFEYLLFIVFSILFLVVYSPI